MVGQYEKIPLSVYLGTGSPSFNKGYGIKRWERIDNCEETFAENFFDTIKAANAKKYRRRSPDSTFLKSIYDKNDEIRFADSTSSKIADNRGLNLASADDYESKRGRYLESYEEFISKYEKSSNTSTPVYSSIVEPNESRSMSNSSPYESKPLLPVDELCDDVVLNSLNDTRSYVEIEGLYCSKMMLAEWASRYLLPCKTAEVPTQTDFPKAVAVSMGCQTDSVTVTPTQEGRNGEINNSLLGQYTGQQNLAWNNAPTNQTIYHQPRPSTSFNQPSQFNNHRSGYQLNQTKFQQAVNWQPMSDEQRKAFHEVKEDLFNVLVVYKCINYRYVIKEFHRIVPEPLNFSKMGMRDLRSLLIQMRDCVTLKKQQYTGEYFVFPKLQGETFENVSHIAEMVAEQRDRDVVPIPYESTLFECDMSELFVEQAPNYNHFNPRPTYATSNNLHQIHQNYNYYWYCVGATQMQSYNLNNYGQNCNYNQQHQYQQGQYYHQNQNYMQYMQQLNSAAHQNTRFP